MTAWIIKTVIQWDNETPRNAMGTAVTELIQKLRNVAKSRMMQMKSKLFHELSTNELYEILKARAEIFVVEQNCVYQDLDGKDINSLHVFHEEGGKVAAYWSFRKPVSDTLFQTRLTELYQQVTGCTTSYILKKRP